MEKWSLYIGFGAGICTGVSLLPQLIKIIKKKKAEDISFVMLVILLAGVAGWIWYGVIRNDYPIIITNSFSLLVNLTIIFCSIKFREKSKKENGRS
jgi:MtN3 and saliva related transmembrane protein